MFRFVIPIRRRAVVLFLVLLPLIFFLGCSLPGERSDGVRLFTAGEMLEPTSLLDLRFDENVVDNAQIGRIADVCPLMIKPPWPGTFQWLSRRSGVYTPSEPPRLGCEYVISLRSGLRRADGQPLAAKLLRRMSTPGFSVDEYSPRGQPANNISSEPRLHLRFNAEVVPESVRAYIDFQDANGQRVVANVTLAKRSDATSEFGSSLSTLTWEERFYQSQPRLRKIRKSAVPETDRSDDAIAHQLVVLPAQPLPVGTNWQLIVRSGLPSARGNLRLAEPCSIALGNVLPFQVTEVQPVNRMNLGKRLRIEFSKALGSEIDETNLLKWIKIDPLPSHLEAALVGNNQVEFKGEFALNQEYVVTFRAGLPGVGGFKLETPEETRIVFAPISPRLYFPAFAAEQLSAGVRKMELLTVNVADVRLRAKLLDRTTVVHALRGYRSYFKDNFNWEEPYREVDFSLMPGKTICQTNVVLSAPLDQAVRSELSWDQILGGRRHGVAFLVAEQNPPQDWGSKEPDLPRARIGTQTLVQITDLGLYWKRSHDFLWVLVFSCNTGLPVPEVNLRLLDNDGEVVQETRTDSDGVALLGWAADGVWLMAEKGDDLRVVRPASLWEDQLPVNPGISRDWDGKASMAPKLMLFSDRPVYRPGEMLNLKAILREWSGQRLLFSTQPAAELRCFDARERLFCQTNLAFTALGTVSTLVALPDTCLGHYRAELRVGTLIQQTHYFQVQQFKPNVFELLIQAPPSIPVQDKVRFPIQAQYYMGRSITRARLQWSVRAEDAGFQPENYKDYSFCTQVESKLGRDPSSVVLTGETNGALPFVLEPEIPMNPTAPQPRALDIQVEMTDLSQQTLSIRTQTVRHSSEFYLGVRRLQSLLRAGEPLSIHLVAVKPDGTSWNSPVKARLRWQKIEWRTVRLLGAGRTASYRSEPEISGISEQEVTLQSQQASDGGTWLVPESAGLHLLEVSTRDPSGHEVLTAVTFHVAGPRELAWEYRNEVQIELVPDRACYQPCQTAQIMVKTPIPGTAVVTIERDRVFRQFITNLTGNAPVVHVPVRPEDAPNIFVSVFIMRGLVDSPRQIKHPDYRIGYCQLDVRQPEKELKVEFDLLQPDYRPGQPVRVRAAVQDGKGRPAVNAEVTLFAVDAGVLSLMDFVVPDPLGFFWDPHPLGVWSHSTLPKLLPEDSGQWRFQNKGYLVGGGGKVEQPRMRKNFQACAFWNATLRTDAEGKVTACFNAPDGLTRYRVIAIALTEDQFGNGQSSFAINKPLVVEPALPRFANVGDHLLARAVVHHHGSVTGQVEITLSLDDTAPGESSKTLVQKVDVRPRDSAIIDFPVKIIAPGTAQWTWRARYGGSEEFNDVVQSAFPVGYAAPLLREVQAGHVEMESNLLKAFNPQLLEGQGTVRVILANSRLVELREAAAHLLHYPYGCAEQTVSSLIPWIVLREYQSILPCLGLDSAQMSKVVQHGIDRLLSMQVSGGGLAYWPGRAEPMLWASAYGGLALVTARQCGFSVPEENLDRLLQYLADEIRKKQEWWDHGEGGNGSLALYTLARAGRPLAALYEHLWAQRERLDTEDRSMLALAILAGRGPREMAEGLLKPKRERSSPEKTWFGGPQRELAIQLLAWLHLDPNNMKVEELAVELLQTRKDGHWSTTQGNAWALLALSEYIHQVESSRPAGTGSLQWGMDQRQFSFSAQPEVFEFTFTNSASLLGQPMLLRPAGPQRIFSITAVETRPRISSQESLDHGFSLQREYARVDEEGNIREFKNAQVGDCVLVTLRLQVHRPARYLAIDDPWPALLEGINPEFRTQQIRAGETLGSEWISDFKELRNDRALFFRDFLVPGHYVIQYLARVRAAGTAAAPSAKVEEMYHPDRFGLSQTTTMTITNRPGL